MTSSRMGLLYVDEARGRVVLVQVAIEKGLWAATVREAQQCVEVPERPDLGAREPFLGDETASR
jgi:hypothetical protein